MSKGWSSVFLCLAALFLLSPTPATPSDGEDLGRGVAQVRSGEYLPAAETLRGVLEKDPGNREARIWLARALSFSGDFVGGEREYRVVLSGHREDVEARLGLADVLAWQKRYRESGTYLAMLARDRPEDPSVWRRLGTVAMWSGDEKEARGHFEKALSLDPADTEARRGLDLLAARAARSYRREAEFGAGTLRIRNGNPGSQFHAAVRDRTLTGWEFLGKAEYLHRFGRDEGRGSAGVVRKWPSGGILRVEGGLSPEAEVFSRSSLEVEAGWPFRQGLVAYAGGKVANYAGASSWNAAAAAEYYLPGSHSLFARYIFSRTEFDVGGSSTDGSWTVRFTRFRTDDDRAWIYYARGTEGYTTGTADRIGNLSASSYGIGGRFFPRPRWGFEGNAEWQDREGGNDYLTLAILVYRRF